MLAAVLLLASCQKDESLDGIGNDGMVDVTLSASMDGASAITRAAAGDGTTVDRCILEVYTGGNLYKRMTTSVSGKKTSFELRLVSSQEYEFLLWADKDADNGKSDKEVSADHTAVGEGDFHYTTTDGLREISLKESDYNGNDETRDAFYYAETKKITDATVISAELKRPFGQLNVYTDLTDVSSDMLPAAVKIESETPIYDKFNVSTGVADKTGNKTFTWSAYQKVLSTIEIAPDRNNILLSTDYLFVSNGTDQNLYDLTMIFYSDANNTSSVITTNDNLNNIPVKRNYRTNVSGELLTTLGTVSVEIKPGFDDDIDKEISEISGVAALNTALSDNANDDEKLYVISGVITDVDNAVTIPETSAKGISRSLEFVDGIALGKTLTITDENSTNDETKSIDKLYLTVPSTSEGSISVNCPNSTVYINGTVFGGDIWTADQTFVINAGAVVTNLTIKKGNVEVYGTLTGVINLGEGNESATVKVMGDKASIENAKFAEDITVGYYNNSTMPIFNANTKKSYNSTDLLSAIEEANSGDVIELAADTEYWYTKPEGFKENTVKVLSIDKNLTIKSEGGAVIVPNYVTTTDNDAIQSTFFIENGATVTFEGLTLMSHIYSYSSQYLVNKVVEVQEGATFNMVNCTTTKNTYVDGYTPAGSGGIYGNESATINITGSTLNNSSLSAGNLDAGTFTVKNTIFDNSFISTPSWDKTFDPQASEFVINVDGCTFQNWDGGYLGDLAETTMVRAAYGTININNTTFPTDDDEYWSCPNSIGYDCLEGSVWGGKISVDGIWYYPDFYNISTSTSYADFKTLYENINSSYTTPEEIYITSGEYDLGYNFGKSVIIYGPNKDLHGTSDERKPEAIFKSLFYCAPVNGVSPTLELHGIRLEDEAAFNFEGGCNLTLTNSVVTVNNANIGDKNDRIYYTKGGFSPSVIVLKDNYFKPSDNELNEIWIHGNVTKGAGTKDCVDVTISGNTFDNTCVNLGTGDADDPTGPKSKFVVTDNIFRNIGTPYKHYGDGTLVARALLFKTASASCPIATLSVARNSFESSVSFLFTYIASDWSFADAPTFDVVNATFSNNLDGAKLPCLTKYNRTVTTPQE